MYDAIGLLRVAHRLRDPGVARVPVQDLGLLLRGEDAVAAAAQVAQRGAGLEAGIPVELVEVR